MLQSLLFAGIFRTKSVDPTKETALKRIRFDGLERSPEGVAGNRRMCCGEGICGSCVETVDGVSIRTCKTIR